MDTMEVENQPESKISFRFPAEQHPRLHFISPRSGKPNHKEAFIKQNGFYFPYGRINLNIPLKPQNVDIRSVINGISFMEIVSNFTPTNPRINPIMFSNIMDNSMYKILEEIFQMYHHNIPPFRIDDVFIANNGIGDVFLQIHTSSTLTNIFDTITEFINVMKTIMFENRYLLFHFHKYLLKFSRFLWSYNSLETNTREVMRKIISEAVSYYISCNTFDSQMPYEFSVSTINGQGTPAGGTFGA